MRIEPPPSVPSANGVMPGRDAGAGAELRSRRVVLSRFHGLRVMPVSGLSLEALQPNSVVVVLPTIAGALRLDALGGGRVDRRDEIRERARARR